MNIGLTNLKTVDYQGADGDVAASNKRRGRTASDAEFSGKENEEEETEATSDDSDTDAKRPTVKGELFLGSSKSSY